MRTWTKSACVVLAWTILSITLVTTGMKGSVHPAQATMRTASSTEDVLTTSTLTIAAPSVTASAPETRYVIQPGDTLSQHRRPLRGTWRLACAVHAEPAGPGPEPECDPPRHRAHRARRRARPLHRGDRGHPVRDRGRAGRPRRLAGPVHGQPTGHRPRSEHDPPRHRTHRPAPGGGTGYVRPGPPAAPGAVVSSPAGPRHHPQPVTRAAPATRGMPQWLKITLLVVGLLILVLFSSSRYWWPAAAGSRPRPRRPRAARPAPAGGRRATLRSRGRARPPFQGRAQRSPARSRAPSSWPTTIGSS